MPSNQQRREAAKRKLQRQLTKRAERARTQRQRLTIVGVVAAVLVIAGGVWFVTTRDSNTAGGSQTGAGATGSAASSTVPSTPCSYPASRTPAKPVTAPTNLSPANTGTVDATLKLNVGDVPLELDRSEAPCAVESFLSLASQNYFSDTTCHRLTTASTLKVLQCGDPTGTGTGGPGYSFADELNPKATYTKGALAMANSGPDTNGSQFFLVYGDSQLPPNYTMFGRISDPGLSVLDAIAAKGTIGGGQDGKPKEAVTITSVTIPSGAVDATGSYQTTGATATGAGSTAPASGETAPNAGSTGSSSAPASGESASTAGSAAGSTASAAPTSDAAPGANNSTTAATTTQ